MPSLKPKSCRPHTHPCCLYLPSAALRAAPHHPIVSFLTTCMWKIFFLAISKGRTDLLQFLKNQMLRYCTATLPPRPLFASFLLIPTLSSATPCMIIRTWMMASYVRPCFLFIISKYRNFLTTRTSRREDGNMHNCFDVQRGLFMKVYLIGREKERATNPDSRWRQK
ncbi:hypothetical protein F5Y17DRAFT_441139 [Xylariaceae sp. FL0594]|nr:hypothetical protein F5Y17DRAFT_441139 [Xylariaceae sp. FL0594]